MTVLIATPWPLRSPGGGQRLAHGIAEALATHGVDVIVAAGSGLTDRTFDVVSDGGFREIRLELAGAGGPGLWRRATANLYLEGLETLAEQVRPRALLFTPHYSSCARQARVVAQRLGIPFLLWPAIHLDHPDHTSEEARRFYRSADRVLCLSDSEREWLVRSAGIRPERVLMPGYPWRGPTHDPRPSRPGLPVRLLSVGAFVGHKRFDAQIETIQILRQQYRIDAQLTLAGTAVDGSALSKLLRVRTQLGLNAHVEFAVDASDTDIATLYHDADGFFFTSRSESFGVAVLEAIARATRPIVYPHAVYRGLVEGAGFGRVAAESTPRGLAAAVACSVEENPVDAGAQRVAWLAQHSSVAVGASLVPMLDQLEISRVVSRA